MTTQQVLYIIIIAVIQTAFSGDVTVTLPNGVILGRTDTSYNGKVYNIFQKIPFAVPPVGELRFKAPVPPDNWNGVLNTTYLDVICYQTNSTDPTPQSEDCLYINVYTPELPTKNKNVSIPVLFYIYGGKFSWGHAMPYLLGPEYLIDYSIVIVTFHYRVGVFGFLSTEDTIIPGNNGLKDQLLALKWVHSNIHLFGGDPDKITISGQSAGGMSVGYQLLHKRSKGLFRGAIMESGTAINPFRFQRNARNAAFALASLLNSTFNNIRNSKTLLDYLLTVPGEELNRVSTQISGWFPVIEPKHDGAFLTQKMYGLIRTGNFIRVPILMGVNSEERLKDAADLNALRDNLELYDNNLRLLLPDDVDILLNDKKKIKFGEAIRKLYCGCGNFSNNLAAGIRWNSDNTYTRATIKCAEMKSKFTDIFFYQFSYDGKLGFVDFDVEGAEHVAHAEELSYLWRITRKNVGVDNSDLSKFPLEDILTQRRFLTLWTNFIMTLNPTPKPVDLLQNVTWPTVTSGNKSDFLYLDIGKNLEIKNHPKEKTYLGWSELYATLNYTDFDTF